MSHLSSTPLLCGEIIGVQLLRVKKHTVLFTMSADMYDYIQVIQAITKADVVVEVINGQQQTKLTRKECRRG